MLVKEIKYARKISEFIFTLIIFKLLCLLALVRASVGQKFDIAFDKKIDIRPNKLRISDLINSNLVYTNNLIQMYKK